MCNECCDQIMYWVISGKVPVAPLALVRNTKEN